MFPDQEVITDEMQRSDGQVSVKELSPGVYQCPGRKSPWVCCHAQRGSTALICGLGRHLQLRCLFSPIGDTIVRDFESSDWHDFLFVAAVHTGLLAEQCFKGILRTETALPASHSLSTKTDPSVRSSAVHQKREDFFLCPTCTCRQASN